MILWCVRTDNLSVITNPFLDQFYSEERLFANLKSSVSLKQLANDEYEP